MTSGKGRDNENNMTFGKFWDSQKMLHLYIYDYMKKKGLHDAADIFSKEANLEMFKILDPDKGLLKEWWELFWTQFSSRLADEAGGNSQSFEQPSIEDVLAVLASPGATSFQRTPVGHVIPTPVTNQQMVASGGSPGLNVMEQPPVNLANESGGKSQSFEQPSMQDVLAILASLEKQGATSSHHTSVEIPQHNVVPTPVTNQQMIASGGSAGVNVVEQPSASLLQTPPVISQRRAGKRPVSTDTVSILRKSLASSPNPSNLHLPVKMQSRVQVTGGLSIDAVVERSNQMDSNWLGQNPAYPPPGLHAGLPEFLSDFLKK